MPSAPKPQYIAVDTNVLLDRANQDDLILDCLATINDRVQSACFVILPTVVQELQDLSELTGDDIWAGPNWKETRDLAGLALDNVLEWGFQPLNYVPVGHGIISETARKIRDRGLVPSDEINDSLTIAEAAALPANILLSSDSHIRDINLFELNLLLSECDFSKY